MAFARSGLQMIGGSKSGNAPKIWLYKTADTQATVNTAGYFDNGSTTNTGMRNEMKVGDIVFVYDTTTPSLVLTYVNEITAAGVIDIANGTTVSNTDSD